MEFDLKIFIYNPCEIINLNYYFSSFRTDRSIPCILLQNFKYYVTADFPSFISLLLLSRKVSIEMFTIHSSHRTVSTISNSRRHWIENRFDPFWRESNRSHVFLDLRV